MLRRKVLIPTVVLAAIALRLFVRRSAQSDNKIHYLTPQDFLNETNNSGGKVGILLGNNTFSVSV
jgi:hypothetical protein